MTKTALYRHWDSEGRLLYVGISLSAVSRLSEHMSGSHWSDQIAHVSVEHFPSRSDAAAAERRAIRTENPIHNVQHAAARLTPPPIPPLFDRAEWRGEVPCLLATLVDDELDEFVVDFSNADEGCVMINPSQCKYLTLNQQNIDWLGKMMAQAATWIEKWAASPHGISCGYDPGFSPNQRLPARPFLRFPCAGN